MRDFYFIKDSAILNVPFNIAFNVAFNVALNVAAKTALFIISFSFFRWISGRRPEFVDPQVVAQAEGREGTCFKFCFKFLSFHYIP